MLQFAAIGCFACDEFADLFFTRAPGRYDPDPTAKNWVTIRGFARYRIADRDRPACGPTIAPAPGSVVRARLLRIDELALPLLDRYEQSSGTSNGGEYIRRSVPVWYDDNSKTTAEVYLADQLMMHVMTHDPPWCPLEFYLTNREYYRMRLHAFLAEYAPADNALAVT